MTLKRFSVVRCKALQTRFGITCTLLHMPNHALMLCSYSIFIIAKACSEGDEERRNTKMNRKVKEVVYKIDTEPQRITYCTSDRDFATTHILLGCLCSIVTRCLSKVMPVPSAISLSTYDANVLLLPLLSLCFFGRPFGAFNAF